MVGDPVQCTVRADQSADRREAGSADGAVTGMTGTERLERELAAEQIADASYEISQEGCEGKMSENWGILTSKWVCWWQHFVERNPGPISEARASQPSWEIS